MKKVFISKLFLIHEYVENRTSLDNISKMLHVSTTTLKKQLQHYNIHIRTRSEAHTGIRQSEEVKYRMSLAQSGPNHPMFGKHHSEETKLKISKSKKGHPVSIETRKKISDGHIGKPMSVKQKRQLSKIRMGKFCGPNSPTWRGGSSFRKYCPKWNEDLRRRIRAFFNYECIICGKSTEENGQALSCHHVEYNKNICCDDKPVCFAALCHSCHSKTNGKRPYWEDIIHRIIDEIYNGKSYYTKEEWSLLNDN